MIIKSKRTMAIQKTICTPSGIEVPGAYHRVEAVHLEGKTQMTFHLRSYSDTAKPFFAEVMVTCAYDLEGDNPIKQSYLHAKTLEEFADATDC